MRTARPMGLSHDGLSLIVATASGEELAIPVDDRLHATLRGDRPRLGQLEIEMDNALGPRDIQSRIRSGDSLEEVGRVAGIPLDRVERFAAPVLAEREHVALLAMSSSVRRKGETSGHRLLRVALTERLQKRGVDIDTVDWDSYRRDDGRWSVSADYRSGESGRQAVFLFDLQGRFSVAGNDEARWVLGEQSAVKGPQPGRRRPVLDGEPEPDTEPTLDLTDELALVRVIQPDGAGEEPESSPQAQAWVEVSRPDGAQDSDDDVDGRLATVSDLHAVPDRVRSGDRFGEQPGYEEIPPADGGEESPLETLASILAGGDTDVPPAYGGLSDASAVPVTDNRGWEPGIVIDYPVEPSPEDSDDRSSGDPAADDSVARASVFAASVDDPAHPHGTDVPAPADPVVEGDDRAEEAAALEQEHATAKPAPRPAGKRKRAAVPSWDDIMFGGPSRPS